MNIALRARQTLPAAVVAVFCSMSPALAIDDFQIDFDEGVDGWRTVLDGVMGGLSSGRVTQPGPGILAFTGELSLENNGGFSQIRRPVAGDRFAGADGVEIEVRGDGRTYTFDIRTSNARLMAGAFQQPFETSGVWTTIRLPFESFRLYNFGRPVVDAPPLEPTLIESIGVTLADKRPGPFELELRSIRAYAASDDTATRSERRGKSLAGLVGSTDRLSVLKAAVDAAGLGEVLASSAEPLTIFAPVDSAFAELPSATLETLMRPSRRDDLAAVLAIHVVPGRLAADRFLATGKVDTLGGTPIELRLVDGRLNASGATVIATDLEAGNGVVHLIDRVLLPERLTASPRERAARVLERAIERGAPLYNAGQQAACAAIYEIALEALVTLGDDVLPPPVIERLERGLADARSEQSSADRAWTYRRAIDDVYDHLTR